MFGNLFLTMAVSFSVTAAASVPVTAAAPFFIAFSVASAFFSMASSVASSGTVAFVRKEFPVQPLSQFFFRSLSHGYYLSAEMQCLACEILIEIHCDRVLFDSSHYAEAYHS